VIVFAHIRNTKNAGDLASCPVQYFDWPAHVVLNYSDPAPACDLVIYGGGTMVNWLARHRGELPKAKRAIWGAGSSRHGMTEPWPDPAGFDLIGTREWTEEREAAGEWAPCVSCMSPLLDERYEIARAKVAFVNASANIRARTPAAYGTGLPTMDNGAPMAEIMAFLGSAETVVTNSYHGMAWASWLGRKVEVLGYSSKFHRFNPSLERSRDATLRFRARVMALYERVCDAAERSRQTA
jgi:hypothetical protein